MLAEILAHGWQEIGAVIHPYPEGEEVSGGQRRLVSLRRRNSPTPATRQEMHACTLVALDP